MVVRYGVFKSFTNRARPDQSKIVTVALNRNFIRDILLPISRYHLTNPFDVHVPVQNKQS